MMQRSEAGGDFVFLAFDIALERGMDVRPGIFDLWQRHRLFRATQRVARVRVFEFDHCPDVARA